MRLLLPCVAFVVSVRLVHAQEMSLRVVDMVLASHLNVRCNRRMCSRSVTRNFVLKVATPPSWQLQKYVCAPACVRPVCVTISLWLCTDKAAEAKKTERSKQKTETPKKGAADIEGKHTGAGGVDGVLVFMGRVCWQRR